MPSRQDQIHQVFQRIVAEASTPTPSGFHKMFVVGQLVVNIQEESAPATRCKGRPDCCGRCHS